MSELIEGDFEGSHASESIVAYQYTDLQNTARAILAKATATANNKIEQAKKNIFELEEKMRQQGYDKGYAEGIEAGKTEGYKAGEVAARKDFEAKIGGLNGALQLILNELNLRKQSIQSQAEADLLGLSLDIAKKIVRREVEVDERFVVPILMEAVALTNNKNDLIVKLSSADYSAVEEEIPTLKAVFSEIGRVSLTVDEGMQQGGVKLSSRDGEVDLSLDTQFKALEKALVGDTQGLQEWDGNLNTELPAEMVVPPVELSVAEAQPQVQPAAAATEPPAVTPPKSEVEQLPKPPVKPQRRRGATKPREANSPAQTSQAAPVDTTTVHSAVDPARVSSLSGVTELSNLVLDSKEESIIKEVLESNVGEGDA